MKVYIRKNKRGEFFNSNMYSTYYKFNELGAEITNIKNEYEYF